MSQRTTIGALVLFTAWSLLVRAPASAQGDRNAHATIGKSADDDTVSPWTTGIPEGDQATAERFFQAGNQYLDEGDFNNAEESFLAALELWNHPAIQYNLVLALIGKKGDPVRIYKALEEATRFDAEPLEPALYERAIEYLDIYGKQLATVEITCGEPGAKVTLDGKPIFTGPGDYRDVVLAGEHTIAATKPGYIAINRTLVLNPQESERITLRMFTLDDRTTYTRRMPAWIPWSVAVSGAVLLGAGGGLQYLSNQNRAAFSELVKSQCPEGCEDGQLDTSLRDRASQQEIGAYIGYGLGGAAVAAGIVMIILNQPKKNVDLGTDDSAAITVVPIMSPDQFGVSASLRF